MPYSRLSAARTSNVFQPTKVRKIFPETWIFDVFETDKDGLLSVTRAIPDTITTWFVSAIAVNNQTGLGVTESRTAINVFKQFFIKLNLPYSIIRGETLALEVVVFNYYKTDEEANIIIYNQKDEFLINSLSENNEIGNNLGMKMQTIIVPRNSGESAVFEITPKRVGLIDINVRANTMRAYDVVFEKLLVKPEGETVYQNAANLVMLNASRTSYNRTFDINLPQIFVPDSERISVSVIGDMLGAAITNIDDLLRVPYGCGEQNMVNFVPNIVALNYLTK
ncbi:CD109 antigen-like protein, partial [Dinothrombium tinctorium]